MHATETADRLKGAGHSISAEDRSRAQVYRLLAKFLQRPPSRNDLALAARLSGDETELGRAVNMLAELAGKVSASRLAEEYHDLFIGVGRGELVPFASYYLTGFLNEKPLARLRRDMSRLGIARKADISEPEDHIATICEVMAGLIDGEFGEPVSLPGQRAFFEAHFAGWAPYFFADLEGARASTFYAALGVLGRAFADIERAAFEMTAPLETGA